MTPVSDLGVEAVWQARIDDCTRQVQRVRKRQRHVEWARLSVVSAVVALGSHLWTNGQQLFWWCLPGVGVAMFFALVGWHRRLDGQLQHAVALVKLNQESLARVRRDFAALPPCPLHVAGWFGDQERDLDLYGPASLGQMVFNLSTSLGDSRLAEWLSRGSPLPLIAQHQQAVQELAPQIDLRQRLYVHARSAQQASGHRLERLKEWAAGDGTILVSPWQRRTGWCLLALLATCLALTAGGLAPVWIVMAPLLINLGFLGLHMRRFQKAFDRADLQSDALDSLAKIVEIIGNGKYHAQALQHIGESLLHSPQRPARALRELAAVVHHSRLRFNLMAYLLLQTLLLWDFHVALKMQRWHHRYAAHVTDWLDATSRFEALSALANLSRENPQWQWPEFVDSAGLQARQAVHPLLASHRAVANDIVLESGRVAIITGSNMSGKTTYMRTLGLNLRLAMAAAPVACAQLRLPPCALFTAIAASDSLAQGMSYFMSEVVQIRRVLDGVRHCTLQPVFLLDELLKGTNEHERNLAIVGLLQALCAQGGMGMMTTHNVALARHPKLQTLCRNIYFEEDIDEQRPEKLVFSYRLKEGISTQTNALKLLQLLGVDLDV